MRPTRWTTSDAKPAGHPIAIVADRTGLSRDVIRVWERRYGVVSPNRSLGGQRLYSDDDLARLRLLAAATRHGRNISQVAGLSTDEVARLVASDEVARTEGGNANERVRAEAIEVLLGHVRAFDEAGLDRVLRRAIAQEGLPTFLEELVPALMVRVGERWHANLLTIAHEHFVTAAVLAMTLDAARAVPQRPDARRLLVATPARAQHALGAALVAAAAALDGWSTVYLGADVPASDLCAAAASTDAHAVAISVVFAEDPDATEREVRAVRAGLRARVPLIVGGAAVSAMPGLASEAGVVVCRRVAELRTVLAREPMTR